MDLAITSKDDPAGATTTQRMGLLGKLCACANAKLQAMRDTTRYRKFWKKWAMMRPL